MLCVADRLVEFGTQVSSTVCHNNISSTYEVTTKTRRALMQLLNCQTFKALPRC